MHEIVIVEDVFRIILGVAHQNRISRIEKVQLVVGEYLQVKPSLLKFAFEAAKEGTIASGAGLYIEFQPVEFKCEKCGNIFLHKGLKYECPVCRGSGLEIINGRDIYVKSIEGE